jgi:Tfp pilus assembly protein PilE
MGQQQLLLLVIAIVIVAFATMTAFAVYEKHTRQDEADGLLDRTLAIATHAVYWKTKNDPFAGGAQSYQRLCPDGMETLALETSNIRGDFAITNATANTVEISAVSSRYPDIGVRVTVEDYAVANTQISYDGEIDATPCE